MWLPPPPPSLSPPTPLWGVLLVLFLALVVLLVLFWVQVLLSVLCIALVVLLVLVLVLVVILRFSLIWVLVVLLALFVVLYASVLVLFVSDDWWAHKERSDPNQRDQRPERDPIGRAVLKNRNNKELPASGALGRPQSASRRVNAVGHRPT